MLRLEGEYAMRFHGVRVGVTADRRLESSPIHFMAFARMSELEVVNFNGLGNATSDLNSASSYFEAGQTQWMFHPAIGLAVGSRADITLGPVIQHSVTDGARSPYLAATRPYGSGSFNQVGVHLARIGWRDVNEGEEHTHHRVLVHFDARDFPAAMDVHPAFEDVSATLGTSITLPLPNIRFR